MYVSLRYMQTCIMKVCEIVKRSTAAAAASNRVATAQKTSERRGQVARVSECCRMPSKLFVGGYVLHDDKIVQKNWYTKILSSNKNSLFISLFRNSLLEELCHWPNYSLATTQFTICPPPICTLHTTPPTCFTTSIPVRFDSSSDLTVIGCMYVVVE